MKLYLSPLLLAALALGAPQKKMGGSPSYGGGSGPMGGLQRPGGQGGVHPGEGPPIGGGGGHPPKIGGGGGGGLPFPTGTQPSSPGSTGPKSKGGRRPKKGGGAKPPSPTGTGSPGGGESGGGSSSSGSSSGGGMGGGMNKGKGKLHGGGGGSSPDGGGPPKPKMPLSKFMSKSKGMDSKKSGGSSSYGGSPPSKARRDPEPEVEKRGEMVQYGGANSPGMRKERRQGGGDCPPVIVLFTRGTGDPDLGGPGLGSVVGPGLAKAVKSQAGGKVVGVQYPADGGGIAAEAMGNGPGSSAMASMAQKYSSSCPKSKIGLAGYSQGAMSVHGSAKKGSGSWFKNVCIAVTFGDPDKTQPLGGKLKTFCGGGDAVCGATPGNSPSKAAGHTGYGSDVGSAAGYVKQMCSGGGKGGG